MVPGTRKGASYSLQSNEGKAFGLILPWCSTAAMNLNLAAVSAGVAPGHHAALLLDRAGWYLSAKFITPANITTVPLPAKCHEFHMKYNVGVLMRDDWQSDRTFLTEDDLVDHCCDT